VNLFPTQIAHPRTLDALVVEDDLVRVRLGNMFEDGIF
jgi:hypothetical protein